MKRFQVNIVSCTFVSNILQIVNIFITSQYSRNDNVSRLPVLPRMHTCVVTTPKPWRLCRWVSRVFARTWSWSTKQNYLRRRSLKSMNTRTLVISPSRKIVIWNWFSQSAQLPQRKSRSSILGHKFPPVICSWPDFDWRRVLATPEVMHGAWDLNLLTN